MDAPTHRWASLSAAEQAQKERYEARYAAGRSPVMLAIERCVCGCDYGADSWTTQTEAERIAERLVLGSGSRLLDIGAGSGWPGLYLAEKSGCAAVLLDLPLAGLRIARDRARTGGLGDRISAVQADASAVPLASASFEAISHSDLLCCLERKREVLAQCRRVISPAGRMAFTVISIAPGLGEREYRRAVENGPEFIETDTDYATLLLQTGWVVAACEDVTAEFGASCRRQLHADETNARELAKLLGEREYAERVSGWRSKIPAIDERLLRRELFSVRPASAAGGGLLHAQQN